MIDLLIVLACALLIVGAFVTSAHRAEQRPSPRHRQQYDGDQPIQPGQRRESGWAPGVKPGDPFPPPGPERRR